MRDGAQPAFCQNEPNLIGARRLASGTVRFCQNEPNFGLSTASFEIGSGRVTGVDALELCQCSFCFGRIALFCVGNGQIL